MNDKRKACESNIGYAVAWPPGPNGDFTINEDSMPKICWKRQQAVKWKKELEEHGFKNLRVVKVRITVEEL